MGWHPFSRGLMGVGLVLALAAGGAATVAFEAPAEAAACHADSCTGLWPNDAGCLTERREAAGKSINIRPEFPDRPESGTFIGTGKIYYSPECRAAWAEYSFTQWTEVAGAAVLKFQFWRQPQYG